MHLFQDYFQPLITWLHIHPNAGLLITFLIAFTESLAIIGSIIPGSVTMTAIGILAGSGVLRIDLTLIAASLGAIAGDSVSYFIGYYFRDRLSTIWPFSRYPNILSYGQIYFEKHGGKSVLIGRFVGPLRSIIPVIAGMMAMPNMRFLMTNIISGIAWAFLYVTPGILIGTASHELSPERATQLVLLILISLVGIWLLSLGMKALFLRFRYWFETRLDRLWSNMLTIPYVRVLFHTITPNNEIHHNRTALLCFSFLFSLLLLYVFSLIHRDEDLLFLINQPIHLCLQSIRTHAFDLFFALAQQVMSFIPVMALSFFMMLYTLVRRDKKGWFLWVSIMLLTVFMIHLYQYFLHSHGTIKPAGILENKIDFSFPFSSLVLATTTFIAFLCHNYWSPHSTSRKLFAILLLSSLFFGSLSYVYLGDLWFTDLLAAFFLGAALSLMYWMIFRKTHPLRQYSSPFFSILGCVIFMTSVSLSCYLHFTQTIQNHQIYFTQHVLSPEIWWHQEKPILPVYSRNRVGKIISVFNVQYVGELKALRQTLEKTGWKKQKSSLIHIVLKKVEGHEHVENPLLGSVYLHQSPTLTMVYHLPHTTTSVRLQLWRSNYYVRSFEHPIWLGHVQLLNRSLNHALYAQDPAIFPFKQNLHHYQTKLVPLPTSGPHPHSLIKANYILLIQP